MCIGKLPMHRDKADKNKKGFIFIFKSQLTLGKMHMISALPSPIMLSWHMGESMCKKGGWGVY